MHAEGTIGRTGAWSRDPEDNFVELRARLQFLAEQLFSTFEPTRGRSRFDERLEAWLDAPQDDDVARKLFGMLDHMYFVGPAEFDVLYREAFRGPIMSWLLGPEVRLDADDLHDTIVAAVNKTWFCPVTDSMSIARFHHLNQITGKDLRPDWRTLVEFADVVKIRDYIRRNGFTRLVLLEDFIATGRQASAAVQLAIEADPTLEVLVVPLVICPTGVRRLKELIDGHAERVQLAPSVLLTNACLLGPEPTPGEPGDFAGLRPVLRGLVDQVGGDGSDLDTRAFGFGKLGVLSVLFTNCPNNAPPVLHFTGNGWPALFPRTSRL